MREEIQCESGCLLVGQYSYDYDSQIMFQAIRFNYLAW